MNIEHTHDISYTCAEIAEAIECQLKGDPDDAVSNFSTIQEASSDSITFLSNKKYAKYLPKSNACACIMPEEYVDYAPENMNLLISKKPYYAYAKALEMLYPRMKWPEHTEPSAYIHDTATIAKGCYIGHNTVIGINAKIGENCYVGHNSVINNGVILGNNTEVHDNVTITHSHIGNNCMIKSGARIGQEGFGFAAGERGVQKIHHIGKVILKEGVEIGANACIDRGALNDTVISAHTKIDNLVQVAHNVQIGSYCFIAGQSGVAGSSKIGNGVQLGGQSGVAGHIEVADGVSAAGQSGIIQSIHSKSVVGGTPAIPIKQWHRQNIYLKKISNRKNDE